VMYRVDITAYLNDEDETGYLWTFLDEARDPGQIMPGALVVAGDEDTIPGLRPRRGLRRSSCHRGGAIERCRPMRSLGRDMSPRSPRGIGTLASCSPEAGG
jgi:hypothetical protein